MSTDAVADVYQKAGVAYSLSADAYSSTTIGSAAPSVETASVDNPAIGGGIPASLLPGVNLLQKTQLFDNAYWTKLRSTVTANVTTAPDGTLTADKLVEDSSTNTHTLNNTSVPATVGLNYIWSVYAKAAERSRFRLRAGSDVGFVGDVIADLLNGSLIGVSGVTGVTGGVIDAGNGWYRLWVRAQMPVGITGSTFQMWLIDTGVNTNYAGNSASGLYLWGAQIEQSNLLSAYTAVA